jgi:hypothetical protein
MTARSTAATLLAILVCPLTVAGMTTADWRLFAAGFLAAAAAFTIAAGADQEDT